MLTAERTLLQPGDPAPVELVNAGSRHPLVVVCEHAGRAVPAALNGLGVAMADMDKHVAYDIGAESVARMLADIFGAPLVLQRYSRLVIDCNRPDDAADLIPEVSDGVRVPANHGLGPRERRRRIEEIFLPYRVALDGVLDAAPRRVAVAIHSFTPVLGGIARPWDIGFLFRKDVATSHRLAETLGRHEPGLKIGMNQPYAIDDRSDWFVPQHGERRNLPHSLIEIRNDHLLTGEGCDRWAERLAACLGDLIEDHPS